MEKIKKTIQRALTTGTTESCTGHCHVIIPDLLAVYHLDVLLTAKALDFGFFDAFYEEGEDPTVTTTTTTAAPVETFYALDDDYSVFADNNGDRFLWIG